MTNSDLQQLFKVEYDKANVISAYPSFLPEEIDYWLNKSYLMTINRKVTGNNPTNTPFEGNTKRIADIQHLVKAASLTTFTKSATGKDNVVLFDLSNINDFLYFVTGELQFNLGSTAILLLKSHEDAQAARVTSTNIPWLPQPVCCIEDNKLKVFYDINDVKVASNNPSIQSVSLSYIKTPKEIDNTKPTESIEVSDSMCYEIITLAVYLALENIESQRVQTQSQTLNIVE